MVKLFFITICRQKKMVTINFLNKKYGKKKLYFYGGNLDNCFYNCFYDRFFDWRIIKKK